jgi:5-formyltetrahydrofolate cyclo-ligase
LNLLKSEIRECIRPLRQIISPQYRTKASCAAAKHFIESEAFQNSQSVASYLALPEEMDTQPLIEALWEAEKDCYLPLIHPNKELSFALYNKTTPLAPNRYQVLEPQNTTSELAGFELDVVLVPLIAFDLKGNRLGTGGGYYDRTFSFLLTKGESKKKKPLFLGLAYELQRVEQIPHEDFDVPLEGILTEEGLTLF